MDKEKWLFAGSKFAIMINLIYAAVFLLVFGLSSVSIEIMDLITNIYDLVASLALGLILLLYYEISVNRYVVLGTALAVLSWAVGSIYWFSYDWITGNTLPYPSIGDLGFTGAYFLLIGAINMINSKKNSSYQSPYRFVPFLLMFLPIVLWLVGEGSYAVKSYNFIFSAAIAYTLYKCSNLLALSDYKWYSIGILLLSISDMIFMTSASVFPQKNILIMDLLYPLSLSLITFGVLKGERIYD